MDNKLKTDTMINDNCPFCNLDPDRQIIKDHLGTTAILDKYPVSLGHALVIPQRHCADYFQLTQNEKQSCWQMVDDVKEILVQKYHPDGFNIGININETAGQTIPHVHIHVIPRYHGDLQDPEGGVRGVIPDKRKYAHII
jgi:ATP adenylyltransferase